MAAGMRAAGRALRRFVKEEAPIFLRGPRPNPAAAAQPVEALTPARHLVSKVELAKRGRVTKKASKSTNAEPWFIGFLFAFAFLEGHEYEMGKRNDQ